LKSKGLGAFDQQNQEHKKEHFDGATEKGPFGAFFVALGNFGEWTRRLACFLDWWRQEDGRMTSKGRGVVYSSAFSLFLLRL
jgi:hypothetical protein